VHLLLWQLRWQWLLLWWLLLRWQWLLCLWGWALLRPWLLLLRLLLLLLLLPLCWILAMLPLGVHCLPAAAPADCPGCLACERCCVGCCG